MNPTHVTALTAVIIWALNRPDLPTKSTADTTKTGRRNTPAKSDSLPVTSPGHFDLSQWSFTINSAVAPRQIG
jgi:hypothetical protein